MNPDRLRWGDSRIDDLANELRTLRDVPAKLAEMAVELRGVKEDTAACHSAVRDMRARFDDYVEEQDREHEADRKERERLRESHRLERKADRRWIVGAVLTAAGLVIAATGMIAGNF